MIAIEAGRDSGGQGADGRHMTERSAGLIVYGWDDDGYPEMAEINVRIDAHPTAVAELRRQYEMIRHLNVYQHMKADDPATAAADRGLGSRTHDGRSRRRLVRLTHLSTAR